MPRAKKISTLEKKYSLCFKWLRLVLVDDCKSRHKTDMEHPGWSCESDQGNFGAGPCRSFSFPGAFTVPQSLLGLVLSSAIGDSLEPSSSAQSCSSFHAQLETLLENLLN